MATHQSFLLPPVSSFQNKQVVRNELFHYAPMKRRRQQGEKDG